jgi:SPP1 family predicted phage head-tail adaptor
MLLPSGNLNPSQLDRRVTLQVRTEVRDAAGGFSEEWVDLATVWAAKENLSGNRLQAALAKHAEARVSFRVRWRSAVEELSRLVHGDNVFEIVAIAELGRRHFLDLTCRALDQTMGDTHTPLFTGSGEQIVTGAGEAVVIGN